MSATEASRAGVPRTPGRRRSRAGRSRALHRRRKDGGQIDCLLACDLTVKLVCSLVAEGGTKPGERKKKRKRQ